MLGGFNMSWLNEHKVRLDEQDAKVAENARLERELIDSWNESAIAELKSFVDRNLAEIKGKKTEDGKKIRIEWDKKYKNQVNVMADDEPFMKLYFHMDEHMDCDGDGCKWGNGQYYINKKVKYCREYMSRDGYKKGGRESGMEWFYEDSIAEYLLKFIKV